MNSTLNRGSFERSALRIAAAQTHRVSILAIILLILYGLPVPAAAQNLLLNADLNRGSGDTPENWDRSPLAPSGTLNWWPSEDGRPAMLEADTGSGQFQTFFWKQTVKLEQTGWYRLRAEQKTDHPGIRALLGVAGAHSIGGAAGSGAEWTPIEIYFKTAPSETVHIRCGVRGMSAGKAYFRDLTLNAISGPPPIGAGRIDLTPIPDLPRAETKALHDLELSRAPGNDSLLSDIFDVRVILAVIVVLAALTWFDLRYRDSGAHPLSGALGDREIRKSIGIAATLCLMLLGTWLATRIDYLPGHGFYLVVRHATGGDAPHYLVMINSLLLKHDLQLKTLYDDVERGGLEAGVEASGTQLDRHTIIVNRRTGHRASDMPWYAASPEFADSADTYEVPAHPPGFPALMALAVAPMQPRAREVEPDVGFILMLIAWLGLVATYLTGRQVGMDRGWALLATATLFAASPWLAYSRAYFAETSIGLALILGLWALMADLPILAALAAGVGAMMKPPFVLVGAGFLFEEIREKRWRSALKIGLVLGLPAAEILAYNFWVHRRAAELSFHPSFQLWLLIDTFLGYREGLLLYAPWVVFGFVACAIAFVSRSKPSKLARTMALPLLLYAIILASTGFDAGYCYGPRYWVAFLPWLALASVEAVRAGGRYRRAIFAILVIFAIAIAVPGALRYSQLFRRPVLDAWRGFY